MATNSDQQQAKATWDSIRLLRIRAISNEPENETTISPSTFAFLLPPNPAADALCNRTSLEAGTMNPLSNSISQPAADAEQDSSMDVSTMSTTPERSQSSSPVLHAGADGETSGASATSENDSEVESTLHAGPIRNICCVGAGYVGMWTDRLTPSISTRCIFFLHYINRREIKMLTMI